MSLSASHGDVSHRARPASVYARTAIPAWKPAHVEVAHERARDARNLLFDAALEFGENWRRDVAALAAERLPGLSEDERAALSKEIEAARRAIEQWVLGAGQRGIVKTCGLGVMRRGPGLLVRGVVR